MARNYCKPQKKKKQSEAVAAVNVSRCGESQFSPTTNQPTHWRRQTLTLSYKRCNLMKWQKIKNDFILQIDSDDFMWHQLQEAAHSNEWARRRLWKEKKEAERKREKEMDEEEKTGFCRRFHCKWMNAERQLNSESKRGEKSTVAAVSYTVWCITTLDCAFIVNWKSFFSSLHIIYTFFNA